MFHNILQVFEKNRPVFWFEPVCQKSAWLGDITFWSPSDHKHFKDVPNHHWFFFWRILCWNFWCISYFNFQKMVYLMTMLIKRIPMFSVSGAKNLNTSTPVPSNSVSSMPFGYPQATLTHVCIILPKESVIHPRFCQVVLATHPRFKELRPYQYLTFTQPTSIL